MRRECKHCGGDIPRRDGGKESSRVFCSVPCFDNDRLALRAEKFWRQVDIGPIETCWEWQGLKTQDGYGKVTYKGGATRAHRVAHTLFRGPISDGMMVLHSCDNPLCCNPHHLREGTALDNERDKRERGRSSVRKGEKNTMATLSEASVISIRADNRPQKEIAKDHGVSVTTVCNIQRRRTWKHV